MEKKEIEKGMEGKELSELNRHELAVAAGNAREAVLVAQKKIKDAESGDQIATGMAALTVATANLALVNDAQVVLASALLG